MSSTPVVTPELTFEIIQGWTGKQMAEEMKNPARRALIDEVLRQKAEEVSQRLASQDAELDAREAARVARRREIEQERERAQKDREAEMIRLSRMTPEERKAEYDAQQAAVAEQERIDNAQRMEDEKDKAYLASLRPAEREAELARRETEAAEKEAAEKAEVDRIAAEKEVADKAEADKIAADKAAAEAVAEAEKKDLEEKTRLAAEAAVRPKERIVVEYQARDEHGKPIGGLTHLEADTWEEMSKKQQAAHENAARFAARLERKLSLKPEFKQPQESIEVLTESQEAELRKNLESKDEAVVTRTKTALSLNEARKEQIQARTILENQKQINAANKFMASHPEYNPCQANGVLLAEYLKAENLEWTFQNLEIAYSALESQMAPRVEANAEPMPEVTAEAIAKAEAELEAKVKAEAEAKAKADAEAKAKVEAEQKRIEQERAAAIANATPPASVAAPASAAAPTPVETPGTAPNNPAPARKLPASGIEPGSLSGGRPTATSTKPAGLTKQDVAKMPLAEFKKRLRDPNFKKQLNAIGIKA